MSADLTGAEGDNEVFDYIIAGAGCAGLSLALHLTNSGKFRDKKILIVDKDAKTANDRTWCFWEKGESEISPVVYREWEQLQVFSFSISKELHIHPYRYKLVRGIDFYRYCLEKLSTHPNVVFLQAAVDHLWSTKSETGLLAGGKKFTGTYLFNSILFNKPLLLKHQHWLLQHFKGWFIKTDGPSFDASAATLMDFRTDQSKGTAFFYMLPFSPTEALVEYTLFSDALLRDDDYEKALKDYITTRLGISLYQIKEKEFGVIPMTSYSFPARDNNIINIGTAGGQTKGSSGYTFNFIQKHAKALVQSLVLHGHPFGVAAPRKRYHFYDSVLLHILYYKTLSGAEIFSELFKKNKPQRVLKFLDNETSLPEEFFIVSSLPVVPFFKAALAQIAARINSARL